MVTKESKEDDFNAVSFVSFVAFVLKLLTLGLRLTAQKRRGTWVRIRIFTGAR